MLEGGGFATIAAQPMAEPASPGHPVLRWSSRARSIDGVARELGKIWVAMAPSAMPDGGRRAAGRGALERHEPRRDRRPWRERRARGGDRRRADGSPSVADADRLAGRPGRAVLDRRPDPGPLHDAVGDVAGDLLRARLRDVRWRERPAHGGHRGAVADPRPAGDAVVAGRAALRFAIVGGLAADGRQDPRRRGRLVRATASPAWWRWPRCRSSSTSRSSTSRCSGRRAGARRSPRPSTARTSCPT